MEEISEQLVIVNGGIYHTNDPELISAAVLAEVANGTAICGWSGSCERNATRTRKHPTEPARLVPLCQRCDELA